MGHPSTERAAESCARRREGDAEPENQEVPCTPESGFASGPSGHDEVVPGLIAVAEAGKSSARSTASGTRERLATAPTEGAVDEPFHVPDPQQRPTISPEETFRMLGINRSTGYKAIQDGTFPVTVLRVGRLIRIPTAALARLLQAETLPPTGSEEG